MIEVVDAAMEKLLRREAPLPAQQIDVAFDPPDKAWAAGVTRPTVNLFLWDIRRNPAYPTNGMLERRNESTGRVERRSSAPFVDLRYFLTAWAPQQQDEHRLLSSVLHCMLGHATIPAEDMPDNLAGRNNVSLRLAPAELRKPDSFWSSLDGRLRAGLDLEVTLPIDAYSWRDTSPDVTEIDLPVGQGVPAPPPPAQRPGEITRSRRDGAVVMEGRR